ncbi:LuxR C-terminal-related transcriptional regulator [Allobranchiibius sp. CTAmp26]|uniref:LuxR C-terminal-related transcriptional regulator n=1 Tax=Allobranchiibius sp. CTAmp26 TaxID=2815214 RepID=UPI001AA0F483|nr:LuxR C-terminal-related transcriptional regulator [Allobranchiibius sp. CTAmp26]MBO1753857.1 hypothetical protein [Allobranchiibius sp. CTAmp26]
MTPDEEPGDTFTPTEAAGDGALEDLLGDTDLTDIYLAALAKPLLRREDLLAGGFNEADINDTIPLLEARGMIRRLDRSSWRVLPPDVVLPAFAARLEDQARAVRASAAAMTRVFQQNQERSQDRDPFEGVQIMTSFAEISQALTRLVGTARHEVMMVYADSPMSRMLLAQPMEGHQRDLVNSAGAPIHVQANYSDTLLDHPNFPEMLRLRAAKGDEQRITPGMRLTTLVNDEGFALVDLEDDQGQPHGLVVTDSAFSTAIKEVCRWGWQIGVPWRMGADGTNAMGAADQERTILQMMAAGASDAAIARHMKLSQRTVERRVRALMDRLNATTRFQAGVLAVRRDLL